MEDEPPSHKAELENKGERDDLIGRAEEALQELAGALDRVSADRAQVEEFNRNLAQVREALTQTLLALNDVMKSAAAREERLQALSQKLSTTVDQLTAKQNDLFVMLDTQTRRYTTFLFWTLLFAAFAVASAMIGVAFFLFQSR